MIRLEYKFNTFCLVLVALAALASGVSAAPQIRHYARSVQPGEVVLLTILFNEPQEDVSVRAFDKSFPGFAGSDAGLWYVLLGLDLELKPGEHSLTIRSSSSTAPVQSTYRLKVEPKTFPTRHLKVEEKYANPPKETLQRIQEESALVTKIFGQSTPARFWSGRFIRCVPGEAISSFGRRSVFNGQPRSPHTGTDFRGAKGTPVSAPNHGRVVLAQDLYFAGNTVILDHGQALYSYLAHLSRIDVKVGDVIRQGQKLGLVGATGRVTGPHLHWSLRLAGTRVDPMSLLEMPPTDTPVL